jgi:gluconate 2-dehydrogenase gamma chain
MLDKKSVGSDEVEKGLDLSAPLLVLNQTEARTVDAVASRIFPTDDQGGGAHEAEVVVFIDRTLEGHARHLQAFYHDGLRELNAYCSARFGGPFAGLSEEVQEAALRMLDGRRVAPADLDQLSEEAARPAEGPEATEDPPSSLRTFFDVMWEHTVQGMFCDPAYGGNKDRVGWRMVGFPGAQWSYSTKQRSRGVDATIIPIRTLTDLQRERPWEGPTARAATEGTERR